MKKLLALFALFVASQSAVAAVQYGATASTYSIVNNFTVCGTGPCGNFTTSMRVQATFVTSQRLAANLVGAAFGPQIVSYTVSDGLRTYSSGDPQVRLHTAFVSTDAAGNITGLGLLVERWRTGGAAHAINDRFDYAFINGATSQAFFNDVCTVVGPAIDADSCIGDTGDPGRSDAGSGGGVVFAAPLLLPQQVPTLNEYALMLLAALMAGMGLIAARRQ